MPTLENHILAAFYSDARQNILYCIKDIRRKIDAPVKEHDDGQILKLFQDLKLSAAIPEDQAMIIKQLRRRFPFIDAMTDNKIAPKKEPELAQPKTYDELFQMLFKTINYLRNAMFHAEDDEQCISHQEHKELYFKLNTVYDARLRMTKQRFGLSKMTFDKLSRRKGQGKNVVAKSKKEFPFFIINDPKATKNHVDIKASNVLSDFGHVMLCSLFLDKDQCADMLRYFWEHQAQMPHPQQQDAINKMMLIYRSYLPIQRLQVGDDQDAVTLDSLSELTRCPRSLFNQLSKADQDAFRVETENQLSGITEENEEPILFVRGHEDRFTTLMMRYFDLDTSNQLRFAINLGRFYHNVRLKSGQHFTDNTQRVRRIGQTIIAYGKLSDFSEEAKPASWRTLEENHKNSQDEQAEQGLLINDEVVALKPYIVKTYPRYHYYDDKIGFRLDKINKKTAYPEWKEGRVDQAKDIGKLSGREMAPHCWLSPQQMTHLAFYHYCQKKAEAGNAQPLEKIIESFLYGMGRLLNQLDNNRSPEFAEAAGSEARKQAVQNWLDNDIFKNKKSQEKSYDVPLMDLPKVLIQHLLGVEKATISRKQMTDRYRYLLEETAQKRKQIDNDLDYMKKRGKKGFKPIKCGHIGDFLIDDFMRFQPIDNSKDDGGKLNSQRYQILQKALAYYGAHIDEPPRIADMLKDDGLLDGEFAHPFLHKLGIQHRADKYPGLISFYKAYLVERERYLVAAFNAFKSTQGIPASLPKWLKLKQNANLQSWLDSFRNEQGNVVEKGLPVFPVPLPRNMFYTATLGLLAQLLKQTEADILKAGEQHFIRNGKPVTVRPAYSWLIKYYLEQQQERPQEMYQKPRQHELFVDWLDQRIDRNTGAIIKKKQRQSKQPQHLSEAERQGYLAPIREYTQHTAKQGTEKAQRQAKLKKALSRYKHSEMQCRQMQIQDSILYLYARQKLEKAILNLQQQISDWRLNTLQNTLMNTPIPHKERVPGAGKYLYHAGCKVRNLGELRLLVRDRRLKTLLSYYPQDELDQLEIRAELKDYRKTKIEIMKSVLSFENQMHQVFGNIPLRARRADCKNLSGAQKDQGFQSISDFGDGRHGDYQAYLYQAMSSTMTEQEQQQVQAHMLRAREIRNAFAHNQYPEAENFPAIARNVAAMPEPDNKHINRKVAAQFLDELIESYRPLVQYLKQ